jgi:hypothetical protein
MAWDELLDAFQKGVTDETRSHEHDDEFRNADMYSSLPRVP